MAKHSGTAKSELCCGKISPNIFIAARNSGALSRNNDFDQGPRLRLENQLRKAANSITCTAPCRILVRPLAKVTTLTTKVSSSRDR